MASNSSKKPFFLQSFLSSYWGFVALALCFAGGLKLWENISLGNRESIYSKNSSDRLSDGHRAFFPEDGTENKLLGIRTYARGNYLEAREHFDRSLLQKPNDPESLIYLNNAIAQQRNPLRLAVSIPATTDPHGAREVLRGVAQAQAETNNLNGINGRGLSITIASDDNDPNTARQIAQTLVDRPDILGVVGHYASGTTLATADIYKIGQLVSISPISSAVSLSNKSPYLFRTIPSDTVTARSLSAYMREKLNCKKAVIYFTSTSEYSNSLRGELNSAIANLNGQVVMEYDLSGSGFNPQQSLQEATQKGADIIILASSSATLDRSLQVVKANKKQLPILGGDDIYSPETLAISGASGKDMVIAVPWHIQSPGSSDFAARSRKLWGGDVNWRTATAYDATQALITALQQNPNRSAVEATLHSKKFSASGASRFVNFLPSGDRDAPVQLVKVVEGNRSGNGYDFEPIAMSF
jgi:branched-chain amino acid transport system substrate-binding protein